jgi:hypothetical protein
LAAWYRRLGFADRETKTFPHLPFQVELMAFELNDRKGGVE